jgi:glycine/D-amino acid oxidase-like deaminating enzyme
VGAGVLGLSAALGLAERGVRVVVLEAREPGFGASGRSGGLIVPDYARLDPEVVRRLLGGEAGDRLSRLVAGAGRLVFDLVRRHAIACDAAQTGWLNPAHAPSRMARLARRHTLWTALGRDVRLLDAAETGVLVGSDRFHGALLDPSGGHVNPLAFARGLARAAAAAGASVHGSTKVTGLRRQSGEWHLATHAGEVVAEAAVIATNAMVGGLVPEVARCLLPLEVHQMATGPLDGRRRATILPQRQAVSDTRANLFSCRLDRDGRLVTGGMAMVPWRAAERLEGTLARRLSAMLPALGETRFTHRWTGIAALTGDFLPRIFAIGPGLFAPVACNGRGLATGIALGSALAAHLCGDASALPIDPAPPRPFRAHAAATLLPRLMLPLARLQDRLAR